MAFVTTVTIGTTHKVSVDYQSQEVSISVTYQLERGDPDLLAFAQAKADEVEKAHGAIAKRIRALRSAPKEAAERAAPSPTPPEEPEGREEAIEPQCRAIRALAHRAQMSEAELSDWLRKRFGKPSVEQLTRQEAAQLLLELQRGGWQQAAA